MTCIAYTKNIMDSSFSLIFPFLLFFFMLILTIKKSKARNSRPCYPPGPWKLPLIGNIHQLLGSLPQRRLRDLANKHGPLMHLKLGQVHHIIISSPETARQVMKTHDISFANRPSILPSRIIFYDSKDVAFAPYGDYWRQMRKICVLELLSAKRVQSFASIRQEAVSDMIKSISSRAASTSQFNLSKILFSLNYDIISKAAFGKVQKEREAKFFGIIEGISEVVLGLTLADLFPSIKLLEKVNGIGSRMAKLHQETDDMLESIVNEHRNRRTMAKNGDDQLEVVDLVDVLLDVQDQGQLDFPLTTESIKAVILDIFIGGSDTSSALLDWAMSELLRHPRVMEKARAEVRQAFGGKGNVEEARLGELNYMKLVVKETLRLYPPGPLVLRECTEGCFLSGYQIPPKTRILVNAWAIGRDPNYWNEAERFNPERFLDNGIDYKGTNFELIPFGAGRRMCPGINFGTTVVELALANLLFYFDWKLPGGMAESIDMQETVVASLRRRSELELIAVQCNPLPSA